MPKHLQHPAIALWVMWLACVFSVPLLARTPYHTDLFGIMLWNMLLAALPLVFAAGFELLMKRNKLLPAVFLLVPWLFFLPNAPYLVTDLIHLNWFTFEPPGGLYLRELRPWLILAVTALFCLVGIAMGALSMHLVLHRLRMLYGKIAAGLALGVSSLLVGIGIYIGRFLRFNSWDVLNPVRLLREFFSGFDGFALRYSLLMAVFFAGSYAVFLCFIGKEDTA